MLEDQGKCEGTNPQGIHDDSLLVSDNLNQSGSNKISNEVT